MKTNREEKEKKLNRLLCRWSFVVITIQVRSFRLVFDHSFLIERFSWCKSGVIFLRSCNLTKWHRLHLPHTQAGNSVTDPSPATPTFFTNNLVLSQTFFTTKLTTITTTTIQIKTCWLKMLMPRHTYLM